MPITCDTSNAPLIVRYSIDGEWSACDLIAQRRELIRRGQLTRNSCVLYDLRGAADIPCFDDLHAALESAPDDVWPVCRAFLVNTPLQHDGAQRLQSVLGPDSVINEIFQDETKAVEWLSAFAKAGALRG
jgi:hypothetical protein